jgi:hypothetical protein
MGLNKDISVRPTKNREDGGAGEAAPLIIICLINRKIDAS